jgi:glyoxylase-like metal-dependent hydrolase (beta-lactamase superfamily II)
LSSCSKAMIKFEEVAQGIWLQGRDDKSNCGVIVTKEGIALVDPRNDALELRAISGFVEGQGEGGEVVAVVLTHGSSEMLPEVVEWANAERIVSPPVPDAEIAGAEPVLSLPLAGWEVTIVQKFSRLGVYNEDRGVLFCGDMLSDVDIPSVQGGGQAYLESLAGVEGLDAKLIIPSTGAVARGKREVRARVERDRNYLYSLYRHVQTAKSANIPLDRALQAAAAVYENYPFVNQHVENVRSLWSET